MKFFGVTGKRQAVLVKEYFGHVRPIVLSRMPELVTSALEASVWVIFCHLILSRCPTATIPLAHPPSSSSSSSHISCTYRHSNFPKKAPRGDCRHHHSASSVHFRYNDFLLRRVPSETTVTCEQYFLLQLISLHLFLLLASDGFTTTTVLFAFQTLVKINIYYSSRNRLHLKIAFIKVHSWDFRIQIVNCF